MPPRWATPTPRKVRVIVGVALAAQKHYLEDFGGWRPVLSALLAILFWPLLLLGINLHIHR